MPAPPAPQATAKTRAQPWKAIWPYGSDQQPLQQMYDAYKKGEKMIFAGNGGGGGKWEIEYDTAGKPVD